MFLLPSPEVNWCVCIHMHTMAALKESSPGNRTSLLKRVYQCWTSVKTCLKIWSLKAPVWAFYIELRFLWNFYCVHSQELMLSRGLFWLFHCLLPYYNCLSIYMRALLAPPPSLRRPSCSQSTGALLHYHKEHPDPDPKSHMYSCNRKSQCEKGSEQPLSIYSFFSNTFDLRTI